MAELQKLFDAIREECSPGAWSRGVELVRSEGVIGEKNTDEEISVRISTRGGMVAITATLYPEELDWECECSANEPVCQHVAAAIIATRKARKQGRALPKAGQGTGAIAYRLSRVDGGLALDRAIVTKDGEKPLRSTLSAIASGRIDGPRFSAAQADIAVERALGARRRGPMDRPAMERLLEPLSRCHDIKLDGLSIEASAERIGLRALLRDAAGGFTLSVRQDPRITEQFPNGVVLCGDVLHLTGHSGLTGRELADLPSGRFYPNDRVAELVTEVLPSLQERLPVDIETERLPATASEKPRIAIAVTERTGRLSILPTLVYGDPPSARVDAGRLVHLQGAIPIRDENAERIRVKQLRDQLGLVPGRRIEMIAEDAIEFASRLEAWHGDLKGDAHRSFRLENPLVASLSIEADRLDLRFSSPAPGAAGSNAAESGFGGEAGGGGRTAAAGDVMRAWQSGSSLVRLQGGGYAALPEDWLERFGSRVADLLAAREPDGKLPTHSIPDLARLCEDLDHPQPASLARLTPLLEDFSGLPAAALPDDLQAELREYQQHGVDWLCFMKSARLGALLADDMGLGKTIQALCALEGRSLVVAPTSLIHNWKSEIERFRPGMRICVYHGPQRELDESADVTLTSYALLRLDADVLHAVNWSCVIVDEAQNIKNPESRVAQAAYSLRADFRMALTGTPVENRLDELWSQLHFLNRGLLGGRSDFRNRYARPIADGDDYVAEHLRQRLKPFVLRRLKRDVAPELPPRTDVVLRFDLSEVERLVYRAVEAATVQGVVERLSSGGNVIAALEALLRLRQAACHPSLVPGQQAEGSSKIELLVERIEQAVADGHKALVFSQWTSLLDLVEPHIRDVGVAFERLDGATRDRGGVVERFQDAHGAPVMLVSLKAGGTGLNLTAADHIFLLDPWWNPAVEDQAADRAHRIGQTRPVFVHRLIAKDTVEERILELHARKRALSDAALGGASQGSGLNREDLLQLLS